ncbi:DUF3488 and DUF4129 domain-containing transglutaminase family protein [Actinoplanes sp. NPDC051494]|uniref:DUF3488 and DUF4129 domain-containing transglutaminase family protein n=1 Tax=Actinoplanes sp. NPDC051494 TaxID=3363907 RepID=UPI003797860A
MTGRRRLGLVAAAATLLSAAPLSAIFDTWTWLLQCTLTVALVAGAAVLTRTLRFPTWAQAAGMVLVLLLTLTWMFPSQEEFLSLIPTPGTFAHFGELFSEAGNDTRAYGVPVPDRDGLLFIAALGIGSVAIAVDLLTVVARRPALAGLPMLAIYSVPVAVYIDSVPVLSFIVGAVGFLWLLVADNVDRVRRFGRRFTGDGRDVDVWEPSPLAAAGRRLAIIGVAAAVLLPLIVPGLNTGLLNQLTQAGSGVGGSGTGGGGNGRINLFSALSGQLTTTTTTNYVKVTTNEPDPFYLRFGIADVLSDEGFSNRTPTGRPLSSGLEDPRQNPDTQGGDFQTYRADVEITNDFAQALAPVYAATVDMDGLDGAWSYDRNAQVIFSNRSTTRGQKYSFDYVRAKYTPNQLRRSEPLPSDSALVTQLTTVPDDPAVEALVEQLTDGLDTPYDKIMALYRHFSKDNGFSYSLTANADGNASAIAAFLENKQGYCQQYAAALAWMARAAGIPARVAFGFTRGSTRDGDAYVLTNRNAHAWTEVYLDGFGWVPFDATPAADVVGSSRSAWAPDNDRRAAPEASESATAAPGASSSAGTGSAARPDRDVDAGAAGGTSTPAGSGFSTTALLIVAGLALLLALLLVPALRRILVRKRRHAATAPITVSSSTAAPPGSPGVEVTVTTETIQAREDAHAAWDELVDTMLDFRVPVDPTETPRHTAQRLIREAELEAGTAQAATLLGQAEERARYARKPLRGEGLTEALAEVRKGMSASATARTRLTALLLPPSVMLRWRTDLGESSTRWMASLSKLREASSRFNPRRMLANRAR